MLIDHRGRVVVVSGAGRGIGAQLARRFVSEGARVVALDVSFEAESPAEVLALECDVTDPDSVRAAIEQTIDANQAIDVLVNNAGVNVEGRVEDLTLTGWQRCFDVNVTGVFLLSQAVIPIMKTAHRGRILNAASFAAVIPSIGSAAYAASKAAVVQFTKVLAGELGPWDITVNAYAPGMIPTSMNGFSELPAEQQEQLLDTLTLRRWERADDVADLLCFLASDAAGYITGTLVDVSGGKLATQIPRRAYEAADAEPRRN